MRDLRQLIAGTSVLALTGSDEQKPWRRVPLKAVEEDIYGKLARRRRKAQMAARRELGVHDDVAIGPDTLGLPALGSGPCFRHVDLARAGVSSPCCT